jgi:hypothetical protein
VVHVFQLGATLRKDLGVIFPDTGLQNVVRPLLARFNEAVGEEHGLFLHANRFLVILNRTSVVSVTQTRPQLSLPATQTPERPTPAGKFRGVSDYKPPLPFGRSPLPFIWEGGRRD